MGGRGVGDGVKVKEGVVRASGAGKQEGMRRSRHDDEDGPWRDCSEWG